jgi:hypothetical protein
MSIATINAGLTAGQQPFLSGFLRAVPTPETKKRPRDFSPGATLRCFDHASRGAAYSIFINAMDMIAFCVPFSDHIGIQSLSAVPAELGVD